MSDSDHVAAETEDLFDSGSDKEFSLKKFANKHEYELSDEEEEILRSYGIKRAKRYALVDSEAGPSNCDTGGTADAQGGVSMDPTNCGDPKDGGVSRDADSRSSSSEEEEEEGDEDEQEDHGSRYKHAILNMILAEMRGSTGLRREKTAEQTPRSARNENPGRHHEAI